MMSEPRPFASLTSSLLARKGFARPAMRPQGHATLPPADDLGWNDMGLYGVTDQEPEDLQNPKAPAASFLTPLPGAEISPDAEPRLPAVVRQQREIEEEFNGEARPAITAEAPAAEPVVEEAKPDRNRQANATGASGAKVNGGGANVARANGKAPALPPARTRLEPGARGKAAFTLRLDAERHLRLRLACAVGHRSAQKLLIEALDTYLETVPGLDDLASSASSAG